MFRSGGFAHRYGFEKDLVYDRRRSITRNLDDEILESLQGISEKFSSRKPILRLMRLRVQLNCECSDTYLRSHMSTNLVVGTFQAAASVSCRICDSPVTDTGKEQKHELWRGNSGKEM